MPWRDRLRRYTILVDESEVGSVSNGESTTLEVDPGPHRLRLTIDWTGSPTLAFDARDGEAVEFDCHARYPLALALVAILESSVRRDRWICLTAREPAS